MPSFYAHLLYALSCTPSMEWEKLEDVILGEVSHRTLLYYGRIVDKHRGSRMNLDTLNPVVLRELPPLFKFKRFTNENLYNQTISRLRTTRRYSDTLTVYYDGSTQGEMQRPVRTLYVHQKTCDVMIVSYTTTTEGGCEPLEMLSREIVEARSEECVIQCIKNTNSCGEIFYEVRAELLNKKILKNLLFDIFEEDRRRRNESEGGEVI